MKSKPLISAAELAKARAGLERFVKAKNALVSARDEFRDAFSDFHDIIGSWDIGLLDISDAMEQIEGGIDELSQYV